MCRCGGAHLQLEPSGDCHVRCARKGVRIYIKWQSAGKINRWSTAYSVLTIMYYFIWDILKHYYSQAGLEIVSSSESPEPWAYRPALQLWVIWVVEGMFPPMWESLPEWLFSPSSVSQCPVTSVRMNILSDGLLPHWSEGWSSAVQFPVLL